MIRTKDVFTKICNNGKLGHQYTDEELAKLHRKLFDMYKDIEAVCKRHNLRITLAYGNLIGVLRHGGWIPWDDDLDVIMPREDYEKLLTEYIDELPEKYKVYSSFTKSGPRYRFAKMVDTTTKFIPIASEDKDDDFQGIFLDIFPLENYPVGKFTRTIKKYLSYFLSYTASSVQGYRQDSPEFKELMCHTKEGRNNYYFRKWWGIAFSWLSDSTWYRLVEKVNKHSKETGLVHVPAASITRFSWKGLPYELLFPTVEAPFENWGTVQIPANAVKFLEVNYDNWRQLPPEEDRARHFVSKIDFGD